MAGHNSALTRQPQNTNLLQVTKYILTLPRVTNVQYFCQEASLPGVSISQISRQTPIVDLWSPGSKLTVSGSNSSSLPLLDLIASGTGSFQRGVRLLNSGLSSGESILYALGRADTSYQMGQMYYHYTGTNSTNRLSFGLHSVDDVLNISGNGYVGVGTTTPNAKLTVETSGANGISLSPDTGSTNNSARLFFAASGGTWSVINNSNVFRISSGATVGSDTGTSRLTVDTSGNLSITGTLTESSSIVIKENVNPITNALNSIMQLVGVTYDRKDGSVKNRAGLIAEDVVRVLPNLVQTDEDGNASGIHYTNLIAYLVESIKELKDEIDILKGK